MEEEGLTSDTFVIVAVAVVVVVVAAADDDADADVVLSSVVLMRLFGFPVDADF